MEEEDESKEIKKQGYWSETLGNAFGFPLVMVILVVVSFVAAFVAKTLQIMFVIWLIITPIAWVVSLFKKSKKN